MTAFKADERIAALEGDIDKVKHHLEHLTEYAIDWFKKLKDKYGKGRERKTELRTFESIDRSKAAVAKRQAVLESDGRICGHRPQADRRRVAGRM